jgi:hypothetical protein
MLHGEFTSHFILLCMRSKHIPQMATLIYTNPVGSGIIRSNMRYARSFDISCATYSESRTRQAILCCRRLKREHGRIVAPHAAIELLSFPNIVPRRVISSSSTGRLKTSWCGLGPVRLDGGHEGLVWSPKPSLPRAAVRHMVSTPPLAGFGFVILAPFSRQNRKDKVRGVCLEFRFRAMDQSTFFE